MTDKPWSGKLFSHFLNTIYGSHHKQQQKKKKILKKAIEKFQVTARGARQDPYDRDYPNYLQLLPEC